MTRLLALCLSLFLAGPLFAEDLATKASRAFAENCFSPYLTARRAKDRLGSTGARYDFYDLKPFSNVAPSPAFGLRPATQGTDRRCEVSFDGNHADLAVQFALAGLSREGINKEASVPEIFKRDAATALLAARQLNPRRVAVVHVGTRKGPSGLETFIRVERMRPGAGGS